MEMINAGWLSLLPPIIAIVLALLTKEVFSSLFAGVFSGMLIYCYVTGESVLAAVSYVFEFMAEKMGENAAMLLFLGLLGAVVMIVNMAGGSVAYGKWVRKRIRTERMSKLATAVLGVLIFIDDYFNCLTVGAVMKPIIDEHKIAREKLAYIIDSTAAPICIIMPVSSWAVAVASALDSNGSVGIFMQTIPYNFYAFLTLVMVGVLCFVDFDFGPMKKAVERTRSGEIAASSEEKRELYKVSDKGTVWDLVIPMLALTIGSVFGMAYVGGFFEGEPFTAAIGENPMLGLTLGAFCALAVCFLMYIPRKLRRASDFMEGIARGAKTMISAMIILILAWSLSGVCRELIGTGEFVSGLIAENNVSLTMLPCIIFVVAAFLSFSMGTAWGTFGILIPIVAMVCETDMKVLIPALGATLAGSVFGDHCSPISDTSILSSTGAGCEHIRHVETQIPYAMLVAAAAAVGYLLVGFTDRLWFIWIVQITLLAAMLAGIYQYQIRKEKK